MPDLNKVERLSTVSGGPFKIVREAAKAGLKGVRNLLLVFASFAFGNLVFFIIGIFKIFSAPSSVNTFLLLMGVGFAGLLFTGIAVYWAYKSIITEIIAVVYAGIGNTVMQVCNTLIDKVAVALPRDGKVGEGLVKSVDVAGMVKDRLDRSPRFIKMGVLLLLQRTPFAKLLSKVVPMLQGGRREDAKQQLFTSVNQYVLDTLLGGGMNWAYVLAVINILLQLLLLYGIK